MNKFITTVKIPNVDGVEMPIEFNDENIDHGLITFIIGTEKYCMDLGKYMLAGNVIGSLKPQVTK